MKIEGPRAVGPTTSAKRAGAAPAAGFEVSSEPAARAGAAAPVAAPAGLDAVLALQAEGFDPGRRSRQVKRAHEALDKLAQLERGLVEGRADGALRGNLEALQRESAPTGEPGLDAILLEIDTRVAVELAKLERMG